MEFILFELFVRKVGECLFCVYILDSVWGYIFECYFDICVVDVYILCLCLKLEEDLGKFDLILIVCGIGYMF